MAPFVPLFSLLFAFFPARNAQHGTGPSPFFYAPPIWRLLSRLEITTLAYKLTRKALESSHCRDCNTERSLSSYAARKAVGPSSHFRLHHSKTARSGQKKKIREAAQHGDVILGLLASATVHTDLVVVSSPAFAAT